MCIYFIYICISPCAKVQHTHENKQFLRPQIRSFSTGMTIAKQIERGSFFLNAQKFSKIKQFHKHNKIWWVYWLKLGISLYNLQLIDCIRMLGQSKLLKDSNLSHCSYLHLNLIMGLESLFPLGVFFPGWYSNCK